MSAYPLSVNIADILDSYRPLLRRINLWEPDKLMNWIEDVAFWLLRVKDQDRDEYKVQAVIFATELSEKLGKSPELSLAILEVRVDQAKENRKAAIR